jgi:GNAT superfamily N-acetyltransferase
MMTIFPLREISTKEIHQLVIGYVSPGRYRVRKSETASSIQLILEREELPEPYVKRWSIDDESLAIMRRAAASGFSFAADDHGHMIAIALCEPQDWNRSLWVWEFHVAVDYRHQGVGRRLMQIVIDQARHGGLRTVVCETQNTNLPAIDFYCAMGFTLEGVDLSYYTNDDVVSGEVAMFMKFKL